MGIAKTIVYVIIALSLILAAAAGYFIYQAQDLKDITVEDSSIEITDVTRNSFTVEGNIKVRNPSKLNIPLGPIEYDIILEDTGETLGTGEIQTPKIKKETTTEIPLSLQATIPESAYQLISQNNVFMTLKGKISIDLPIARNYPVPFEHKFDIKSILEQNV